VTRSATGIGPGSDFDGAVCKPVRLNQVLIIDELEGIDVFGIEPEGFIGF
jgi:hypothetical protein